MWGFILSFDLQEKVTDLTDILFLIVNFLNFSSRAGRNFSELFIGCNIGQLLKLGYFFSFSDIQFFDGSLFNLLSKVREIEFEYSESVGHKLR